MTYAQFKDKYNNKRWDYDGYYGDQCVDLIQFYARELGLPTFWGNAADIAGQYPAGWVHVSVPVQGDVVVFARNAGNGYAGHIAIYDRPGYYLSQNYPTGTNTHIQYINEPIIGILRPTTLKGGNMDLPRALKDIVNLNKRLLDTQKQVIALRKENAQLRKSSGIPISELQALINKHK